MADKRSVFWRPEATPLRIVPGTHVPAPKGLELVEAMQENVREASALLNEAETRVRALRSTHDISEDPDSPRGVTALLANTEEARIALSDVQRARAEVAHWTEYLGWAKREAHAAAPRQDLRLPVEREPGEDDGDEARNGSGTA